MRRLIEHASLVLALMAGCSHSATGLGDDGGAGGDLGDIPFPDGGVIDPSCAKAGAKAGLKRVDLVIMLDSSGSMGDGVQGDPAQKWIPVTHALENFFSDPTSLGMSASLQYFPLSDECNSSAYYYAAVPMTALPESQKFAASIAKITPAGDTPTLPAVSGAIDYAKSLVMTDPGARKAIVLVTDGEPDACMSGVIPVSTAVAKVAATIPTYVIGVGDAVASLDAVAMNGGTDRATLVSTTDPTQTSADFLKALEAIRGLVLTCDFAVPATAPGFDIDFENVNVVYTPGGGAALALPYSKDCQNGGGWHYDDPTAPKKVTLCPTSCDTVRNDATGQIDVVFGCATLGGVIF